MKFIIKLLVLSLFSTIGVTTFAYDFEKAKEAMPFLNSDYAFEYLRVQKIMMGDKVIGESRTETTYNDQYLIASIVGTMNGQKTLELVDYEYGDRSRTHTANTYVNGQLYSSALFVDTFGDDYYRNMTISEIYKTQSGIKSKERIEWTYDNDGRITSMKHYQDDKLAIEQKDYIWTPNSCEYTEISYFPTASTSKVKKTFRDSDYVQNILEIHEIEMNGVKTDTRGEFDYDDKGNLISMKSYNNGQLLTEWSNYSWGNKQNTHKETMYMNGTIISESIVEQYYK